VSVKVPVPLKVSLRSLALLNDVTSTEPLLQTSTELLSVPVEGADCSPGGNVDDGDWPHRTAIGYYQELPVGGKFHATSFA
jgi:hypothetical protein